MPAEWTPHERCWMAWPCRVEFWSENLLATQKTYADVANAISAFEPVTMLAPPSDVDNCRNQCGDTGVHMHHTAAGKIHKAALSQPATTPHPVSHRCVDQQ